MSQGEDCERELEEEQEAKPKRNRKGEWKRQGRVDHRTRQDMAHQVFYATRELQRHQIPADLFDLEALIDPELTYTENRALVVLPILRQHSEKYRGAELLAHMERYGPPPLADPANYCY